MPPPPRHFLFIGNGLHSSSLTLPEFQEADSKQLLIREGRKCRNKGGTAKKVSSPQILSIKTLPQKPESLGALTMSHPFSLISPTKNLPLIQTDMLVCWASLCLECKNLCSATLFPLSHFQMINLPFLPPHSSLFPSNR